MINEKNNLKHDLKLFRALEADYKKQSKTIYNVGGKWKGLPELLSKIIFDIKAKL